MSINERQSVNEKKRSIRAIDGTKGGNHFAGLRTNYEESDTRAIADTKREIDRFLQEISRPWAFELTRNFLSRMLRRNDNEIKAD